MKQEKGKQEKNSLLKGKSERIKIKKIKEETIKKVNANI
jgi:hypothetical protein